MPGARLPDGHDLTGLALERVANVPAVCIDRVGVGSIDLDARDLVGLADHAILIRTDHSHHWGTEQYFSGHPFLTEAAADELVAAGVACVGIDSLNIDSTVGGDRPVHAVLLSAGIPIIEHLTGLDALPPADFRFSAVPPKIAGAGTFTVRAFADLSGA